MPASAADRLVQALGRPSGAAVTLRQLDFAAQVASEDLRALAWIGWFLRPFFAQTQDPPDWRITFLRDDDLFEALRLAEAARPRREVASCVQHSPETNPSRESLLEPFRLLYDGEFDAFCAALPQERQLLVTAGRANFRSPSTAMRGLRELASLEHQQRGAVVLHAAAIEQDGQATLALAPKRGGKTTFLMGALLGGARLVANDRLVLHPRPDGIWAVGVPTVVAIRTGTLDLFPDLKASLDRQWVHFRRRGRKFSLTGKCVVSPLQLCRLTGASAIPEARVAQVLFLVEGAGPVRELTADEACHRLEEAVFDFTDTERHFFASLHPVEGGAFRQSIRRLCGALCRQARCWEYPREGSPRRPGDRPASIGPPILPHRE